MKRPHRAKRPSSFTLIEMLVVIAIITILATVLISAGTAAINAALRAKAAAMANQIQVACMSYYNDYSVYPLASTATAGTQYTYGSGDTNDWEGLSWALCGNLNAASPTTPLSSTNVPNTRAIQYLQLSKSSVDANGVPINPTASASAYTYFNICIDGAYCGILSNVPSFSPGTIVGPAGNNISGGIYVWLNGNPATGGSNVNFWVHAP